MDSSRQQLRASRTASTRPRATSCPPGRAPRSCSTSAVLSGAPVAIATSMAWRRSSRLRVRDDPRLSATWSGTVSDHPGRPRRLPIAVKMVSSLASLAIGQDRACQGAGLNVLPELSGTIQDHHPGRRISEPRNRGSRCFGWGVPTRRGRNQSQTLSYIHNYPYLFKSGHLQIIASVSCSMIYIFLRRSYDFCTGFSFWY